jgi:hypothetical protein
MIVTDARINIENFEINTSLQVGDELYYTCAMSNVGFTTVNSPTFLGTVTNITNDYIDFTNDDISSINCDNIFLSFKKDCAVNNSGLKGYFALATFLNNDYNNKNELFAISSQVSFSSK